MTDLRSAPIPPLDDADHVRGAGPLVIFYGDFACPHCALAHRRLSEEPVRRVFRHFTMKARHPRALTLAHAVEAAALQGAFWDFHDSLYEDQGRLDDPHLWERAETLGLDVERFDADRRGEAVADRVQRDVRAGLRAGIVETPTLVLDGVLHPGARMPGFGNIDRR